MLIFLKWMLKVLKKEHAVLTGYQRSHPNFLRYLALDALLSVALVFAGFQIYDLNSTSAERLSHAGDVVLSSGQLIDHLNSDGLNAYWIGPVRDAEYTVNHELEGIVDVMYLPKGINAPDDNAFVYEIKTYRDQAVWDAHTHTILAVSDTTRVSVNENVTIKINKSSMKGVIATFADKPEIVAIAYPRRQTLDDMIKNIEGLKLIR